MGRLASEPTAEQVRLTTAKADHQELINAKLRGEMIEIAEVEAQWSNILRIVRSGMLALPSRVAQRLPQLTRADKTVIDSEVRAILEELASHEFGSVKGDGGSETASEPTSLDLGRNDSPSS